MFMGNDCKCTKVIQLRKYGLLSERCWSKIFQAKKNLNPYLTLVCRNKLEEIQRLEVEVKILKTNIGQVWCYKCKTQFCKGWGQLGLLGKTLGGWSGRVEDRRAWVKDFLRHKKYVP